MHRRLYQSNSQTANLASTGGMAKKVFTKEEWNARLSEVQVDREDLNKLVMNYLIIEGFKDAAEKFSQESGTKPPVNLESIQDRMVVRTAIQRGHIEEAIERVNDLNPEILDTNPKLFFHLQQQRLIEYIREGRIMEALEFAQEELAPRGEENPEFLSELERTMSLLAFEVNGASPVNDLLTPGQRQKLASELNSALLLAQSQEKDPKLPTLLKTCWWFQQQLDERCTYPKIKDFTKAELVMEPMGNGPIGGSASAGAGGSGSASGPVAGA
ncbi:Glucose-induced degradation complex subunit [Mortierella antarctica]|nr:Glucose-induced degradation complex subunit [Mortierella antarctica]